MNILCIETSASLCSVAIVKNKEQFYCENSKPMAHAEVLMALIKACLEKSGIEIGELNAVALSGGPGSYTGLRIGCSAAKGLCYGLKIPLIVIDTLKIIAAAAINKIQISGTYWAMIDARRMEVYHAIFNQDLEQITATTNGIINEDEFKLEDDVKKTVILCGDGASKAAPVLQIKDANVISNALYMCEIARKAFQNSTFVELASYEPFYLKQANITVSKT